MCLQYFKKGQRFPAAWAGCAVPGVRGLFGRGLFAVGGRLNVLLAAGGIPGGFFAAGGVLGVALAGGGVLGVAVLGLAGAGALLSCASVDMPRVSPALASSST